MQRAAARPLLVLRDLHHELPDRFESVVLDLGREHSPEPPAQLQEVVPKAAYPLGADLFDVADLDVLPPTVLREVCRHGRDNKDLARLVVLACRRLDQRQDVLRMEVAGPVAQRNAADVEARRPIGPERPWIIVDGDPGPG